jgi:hypothetical protein
MKGKIGPTLFALPFFSIGVWMTWSIAANLFDAWQMQRWTRVDATLMRAGYETHSGDESDTYEAYAEYSYVFDDREYRNDRVAISSGGDNIGEYQRSTGRRLERSFRRGDKVTAYVNPDDPSEAILDPRLRWGLIGFKSIFMLVFGGIGLGMLIYILRTSTEEKDASSPQYSASPWLLNDAWQTATIRSNAINAMWFTWSFAALWNLISAPIPFLLYEELVTKGNKLALIALLFPLAGLWLLARSFRLTLEWLKFGLSPVTLDPFPGSIGGHVGGTIDLGIPFNDATKFSLTLTNVHSYMSGSGDDRSRRESAKWQDSLVAHAAPGPRGTRLRFRFDVPKDLEESDAQKGSGSYHLWRLNLQAELPGVDVDRDYELPVYPTSRTSRNLSGYAMRKSRSEQNSLDEQKVRSLFRSSFDAGGRAICFPMGRHLAGGTSAMAFGSIFAGTGWFLGAVEGHWIFGGLFGFLGAVIMLSGLYFIVNSLEVRQTGDGVESVRRILGLPLRRTIMRRADFVDFEKSSSMQSNSNGMHVIYYSVYAIDRTRRKLIVGEGFKGAGQADAAARLLGREFGLNPVGRHTGNAAEVEYDPLGPDQESLA